MWIAMQPIVSGRAAAISAGVGSASQVVHQVADRRGRARDRGVLLRSPVLSTIVRVMKNIRSKTFGLLIALLIAASVGSCGGSGGGSCGKVQPCGGSVVGTWKAGPACVVDASLLGIDPSQICSTATIEFTTINATGSVTFGADMTYHAEGTDTIAFKITVPGLCFATGKNLRRRRREPQAQMQQDPAVTSASCATAGAACVCNEMAVMDSTASGTYSTSGTTLTTTPAGKAASSDQYCVQGNELHDLTVNMTMPMGSMGMVKIAGDFVLTKQ